jgi:ABC-type multidrug transport system ATPase subunit
MLLSLQNITKVYKRQTVLNNINLIVNEGEIHFLIGPNGSGKSTLMNIILGVALADKGEIDLRIKPNQIGSSLSANTFFPHLSAKKNLAYYAAALGIKHYRAESNPFFTLLEQYGKKRVRKYSSGMKKVLSLAIAFIGEPKLLILDEPTNFLDIDNKNVFMDLLRRLSANGTALLIPSHHTSEIAQLNGICSFIDKGTIKHTNDTSAIVAQFGNLENAYKHYTG